MRSVRPALGTRSRRVAVLLVAAFCVAGVAVVRSPGPSAPAPAVTAASSSGCPGTAEDPDFDGTLAVAGGPLAASAASDVGISYSYYLESVETFVAGNTSTTACTEESGATTTEANGSFSFAIPPPAASCGDVPPLGAECTTYSGPYGPIAVDVAATTPAGYGLSSSVDGPSYTFTWVAGLARVTVGPPSGTVVLSTGAPATLVASAEAANGTPSSLAPWYQWTVNGTGWSFTDPPGAAASAAIVAGAGAGPGTLEVLANDTVGSNEFETPPVALTLEATPTTVDSGTLAADVVDAGQPLVLRIEATGAPGYSYNATVAPGLGVAPFAVPCTTSSGSQSAVAVACATSVTFPSAGSTSVRASVSNGYSSSAWTSPALTVDPTAALSVAPTTPVGYVGDPIAVTLAAGSGDPPYRSACFLAAGAVSGCSETAGPNWTFDPTFAAAGNYTATASVEDSSGANATLAVAVRVVPALAIGTIAPEVDNLTVGVPTALPVSFSGGDLPADVWWNTSGDASPIASYSVDEDGILSANLNASTVGPLNVTVTVRDALGSEVDSVRTVEVIFGPARSISASGPASDAAVVVGTPEPFSWQALDAAGGPDAAFAANATLSLAGPRGDPALAWANETGGGPLAAGPQSSFVVPAAAWTEGRLELAVTPLAVGALTLTLSGGGALASTPTLGITMTPDSAHLRLFDPTVVQAGDRTNRTFWHVSDRFGNPVPDGYVVVQYEIGASAEDRSVSVEPLADGATGVWVNFTLAGPGESVQVLDPAGGILLGPVTWPEPALPAVGVLAGVVLAAGIVAGGASALVPVARRRRRPSAVPSWPDEEAAAQELAEGRAAIVEIVRSAGLAPRTVFEELARDASAPRDLFDWLASLVADGTLLETRDAAGGVAYLLAPEPPEPERVVVDPAAIDRAIAARDRAVRDDEGDGFEP